MALLNAVNLFNIRYFTKKINKVNTKYYGGECLHKMHT